MDTIQQIIKQLKEYYNWGQIQKRGNLKRPIIIILISYIIGILGGLYTNSIAFFCFTIILAMCLWDIRKINNKYFRFLRRFLKRYTELLILISMTFGFLYTNILEQKYDTIYEAKGEIEEHCIVIAEKEPKEYKDLYKVKIVNSKNSARNGTKLYIRVNKKANIEVGDMLSLIHILREFDPGSG